MHTHPSHTYTILALLFAFKRIMENVTRAPHIFWQNFSGKFQQFTYKMHYKPHPQQLFNWKTRQPTDPECWADSLQSMQQALTIIYSNVNIVHCWNLDTLTWNWMSATACTRGWKWAKAERKTQFPKRAPNEKFSNMIMVILICVYSKYIVHTWYAYHAFSLIIIQQSGCSLPSMFMCMCEHGVFFSIASCTHSLHSLALLRDRNAPFVVLT